MGRVGLRRMGGGDLEEFVGLAVESVELHAGRVYTPVTPEGFEEYLGRFGGGEAEAFLIRRGGEGGAVGLVTISGIVRGPYQRGVLGYAGFASGVGKGYVTEGVGLAVRYGFGRLGLHRLEADVEPDNVASLRLVERLGFRREGYSPGFIQLDGRWRDYERWAITPEISGGLGTCEDWQLPDTGF
ncbi:GNAT family protein [Actinocorallia longicatena]|uniref:GNAT family protein n=1 Tax=Actinocorallia longicatena TaxID=111803 RepID=A0ABP6QFX6_9ACTN